MPDNSFGSGYSWDQISPGIQGYTQTGADSVNGLASLFGYKGDTFSPEYNQSISDGYLRQSGLEGEGFHPQDVPVSYDPNFSSLASQYRYTPTMNGGYQGYDVSNGSGNTLGNVRFGDKDSAFDKFAYWAIPTLVGAGFGGGVAGAMGGGTSGAIAGGATQGAVSAYGQGGDPTKGAITGAIGGGLGSATNSINPAGTMGVTNPTYAGMINQGVGSAAGTALRGGSLQDSLKSGIGGAAVSGMNSAGGGVGNYFKDMFTQFSQPQTGGMESMYDLPGNMQSNPVTGEAPDSLYNDQGQMEASGSLQPSGYQPFTPNFSPANTPMGEQAPQQTVQSSGGGADFGSLFSNAGSSIGNYLGGHGGDLASMLYGFYNNKKQQGALQQQLQGLQGLYGQNSPYAQQLRAKLQAQAAQKGTRLNTGGRETQLQAMLADRAASMAPSMYQLQGGINSLQNSMGANTLSMLNKMGGFKALGDLFRPTPSLTGVGSNDAYGRMDDMYSNLG